MMTTKEILYPELSYKIIGCAFEVFNEIGGGHKELTYHKALKVAFEKALLRYEENLYYPIKFKSITVEKGFFDFFIDEKIVVELKSRNSFLKKDFEQLTNYLNNSKQKLGILIAFGTEQVKYKRVLNTVLLNKEKELQSSTTPSSDS